MVDGFILVKISAQRVRDDSRFIARCKRQTVSILRKIKSDFTVMRAYILLRTAY